MQCTERERGGKQKELIDFVQSDIPVFGILGSRKAVALKSQVWGEKIIKGWRRFMAAWRKEEVDTARHGQEK